MSSPATKLWSAACLAAILFSGKSATTEPRPVTVTVRPQVSLVNEHRDVEVHIIVRVEEHESNRKMTVELRDTAGIVVRSSLVDGTSSPMPRVTQFWWKARFDRPGEWRVVATLERSTATVVGSASIRVNGPEPF